MKTARKLQLDRTLFWLVALLLNGVARLLGRLLRRDHSVRDENVRVIVLAKFVGLGSITQSTVLLRSLRARYPAARILYFTLAANAEFCRRLPGVDGVVWLDDRSPARAALTSLGAIRKLWLARVDLYFDLEVYSHLSSILATLSLARNRYGFFRQSCQFKHGLHTHLLYLNCFRHISEAYGQMARLAGAEPFPRLGAPELSDPERSAARAFIDRLPAGRLLAVNANASDLLLERRWPPSRFAALIEQLAAAQPDDWTFILIGGPGEREYLEAEVVARLSPAARERAAVAAGELSLFETLALLEQCDALVTNDSGPMHFAFALRVPAVTLWGPGLPAHYGPPPGAPARVIYRDIYCSPCLYHTEPPPCGGDNQCMQRIEVAEVAAALANLLGFPPLETLPSNLPILGQNGAPLGVVLRPEPREKPGRHP